MSFRSKKNPIVKAVNMDVTTQNKAFELCEKALDTYEFEKDIAAYVKKGFDEKYGPTWQCIVGRSFGSFVTHEENCFLYFFMEKYAILLFRTK